MSLKEKQLKLLDLLKEGVDLLEAYRIVGIKPISASKIKPIIHKQYVSNKQQQAIRGSYNE